jgi:hypothetical protein
MVLHIQTTDKFTVIERNDKDDNMIISEVLDGSKSSKEGNPSSRVEEEVKERFSEWNRSGSNKTTTNNAVPVMDFMELMDRRNQRAASNMLWSYLEKFGYVILTVPSSSTVAKILHRLQETIEQDFFPRGGEEEGQINCAGLLRGDYPYISERGVPMYRLGYECCDDGVREVYRVHCGRPDSQPWPTKKASSRYDFLRGMCLCRYICDVALELTLGYDNIGHRKGSGRQSWKLEGKEPTRRRGVDTALPYYAKPYGTLPDRKGDYSVMYAMHYFNNNCKESSHNASNESTLYFDDDDDVPLNVKSHVDPSLFVLEPYLSKVEGLQIRPAYSTKEWITVDGISSNVQQLVKQQLQDQEHGGGTSSKQDGDYITDESVHTMVLFVGRAFAQIAKTRCGKIVSPTLHRVIAPNSTPCSRNSKQRRRIATIYEQKYEEYFPPPLLD